MNSIIDLGIVPLAFPHSKPPQWLSQNPKSTVLLHISSQVGDRPSNTIQISSTLHSHCLSNRLHQTLPFPMDSADSPTESVGHDWIPLVVQAKSSECPLKPLKSKKWLEWPEICVWDFHQSSARLLLDFHWTEAEISHIC